LSTLEQKGFAIAGRMKIAKSMSIISARHRASAGIYQFREN
jgi:hypothetical protein